LKDKIKKEENNYLKQMKITGEQIWNNFQYGTLYFERQFFELFNEMYVLQFHLFSDQTYLSKRIKIASSYAVTNITAIEFQDLSYYFKG